MKELNKLMYYRASAGILDTAKLLRKKMTVSEELLWNRLNKKQILGLRFRRQHPIDIFIADFYCHEAKLVVEIDGEIHAATVDYDLGRTAEMDKFGLKTIRFTNQQVLYDIESVVEEIKRIVSERIHDVTDSE
jgi:very-short-patch-repair endonuclease